jgi:dolichyl-phosphate-mannose-protein mannosyltransferase
MKQPKTIHPQPLTITRQHIVTSLLLMCCALTLYLWRLDQPERYVYDEVYHAYTAVQLANGNQDAVMWNTRAPDPDVAYEWTHPPFAKYMMEGAIVLWGDNPWGWRFASAVFGALGIGIVYVLGTLLFEHMVGVLAAVLLLLDGLWFVQARTAMNDIYVSVLLLLAYLVFALYLRNPRRHGLLWLVGGVLGLAIACKWSALYSWLIIGGIALLFEVRQSRAIDNTSQALRLGRVVGAFGVVPLLVYVANYVQFWALGHTFGEWSELQRRMWSYHANLQATHPWQSPAWSWPLLIKPVWYYVDYQATTVANIFALGNPLIWWLFLPAVAFVWSRWRKSKGRSIALGIVLLGFFAQWLPWFISPRITFLYHMLPSVPFGCLAIAYGLHQIRRRLFVGAYLVIVMLAFVYFYPQYAAWPVSPSYAAQQYWLPWWSPR